MKGRCIESFTINPHCGSFDRLIGVFELHAILTGDWIRRELRNRQCEQPVVLAECTRTKQTAERRLL
jgi:hypothetical protein